MKSGNGSGYACGNACGSRLELPPVSCGDRFSCRALAPEVLAGSQPSVAHRVHRQEALQGGAGALVQHILRWQPHEGVRVHYGSICRCGGTTDVDNGGSFGVQWPGRAAAPHPPLHPVQGCAGNVVASPGRRCVVSFKNVLPPWTVPTL